jgi:hypothetical protein
MMRRKLSFVAVWVILFWVLVFGKHIQGYTQSIPSSICDSAIQIAQTHMTTKALDRTEPDWQNAILEKPVAHYDLNNNLSACVFSLSKESQDVGYIVVSMKTENPIVVEFSNRMAAYKADLLSNQTTAESGALVDKSVPLYLGALSYYYRVCDDIPCKAIDAQPRLIEIGKSTTFQVTPQMMKANDLPITQQRPNLPSSYKYINGVPNYYDRNWQRDGCDLGCSPSGAGAVIAYWSGQGYANLMPQGDLEMMWDIHKNYMFTYCNGWTFVPPSANFGSVVVNYAANHGYANFSTSHLACWTADWSCYSGYVAEIDNNRPAILTFSAWPPASSPDGHTVAGVGYSDNDLIVYDNAWSPGSDTYIRYGTGYEWMWVDTVVAPFPDTTAPVTSVSLGGTLGENNWYTSAVQVTLTAADNSGGSGVGHTQYKIDNGSWQPYSTPLSISANGNHTVYYNSRDVAGNWEIEKSVVFAIDTLAPTGSLTIQNGAAQTYSTLVGLNAPATDATSGVAYLRFRDPSQPWSSWSTYPSTPFWSLAGNTGQTLGVEVQFRDHAGNLSAVYSDHILLNIYPARPGSTLYRLSRSTFGASGTQAATLNYVLGGTSGQPSLVGMMNSSNYRLTSGYWAAYATSTQIFIPFVKR